MYPSFVFHLFIYFYIVTASTAHSLTNVSCSNTQSFIHSCIALFLFDKCIVALRGAPTTARRPVPVPRGGVGGGRGAQRGVSNLPPSADGFRWADRDESA